MSLLFVTSSVYEGIKAKNKMEILNLVELYQNSTGKTKRPRKKKFRNALSIPVNKTLDKNEWEIPILVDHFVKHLYLEKPEDPAKVNPSTLYEGPLELEKKAFFEIRRGDFSEEVYQLIIETIESSPVGDTKLGYVIVDLDTYQKPQKGPSFADVITGKAKPVVSESPILVPDHIAEVVRGEKAVDIALGRHSLLETLSEGEQYVAEGHKEVQRLSPVIVPADAKRTAPYSPAEASGGLLPPLDPPIVARPLDMPVHYAAGRLQAGPARQRGFEFVSLEYVKNYGSDVVRKKPVRSDPASAGHDLFVPIDLTVPARGTASFWSDIKAYMLPHEVLCAIPRSSTGTRDGLMISNTVGVIDSSYYANENTGGNIKIFLTNLTDKDVTYKAGDRVVQLIFSPYLITDEDVYLQAERTGGMGSSGR